ncbi:hypothetical protein SSCG_05146 [Streptomyces clavuligerus]|nr:hypothetical protein SSCG_05146 [Streptomyces clavuligerus]
MNVNCWFVIFFFFFFFFYSFLFFFYRRIFSLQKNTNFTKYTQ